jgi:hypothetical protein
MATAAAGDRSAWYKHAMSKRRSRKPPAPTSSKASTDSKVPPKVPSKSPSKSPPKDLAKTPSKSPRTAAATRRAIDELFLHPPLNDGDLRRRLGRLNVREARQLLVTRLSQGAVRESEGQLFRAALALVGLGEERERLIEIALDVRRTASQRGHALAVLDEAHPGAVAQLATRLPPEEMLALGDIPLIDLLVQILAEPGRPSSCTSCSPRRRSRCARWSSTAWSSAACGWVRRLC